MLHNIIFEKLSRKGKVNCPEKQLSLILGLAARDR